MRLPKLFKRSVNGKTLEWEVEVNGACFRTISGYTDGVKTISEFTCCEAKNTGKKNATTPEQQAIAEAKSMWTKRIELGSYESISDIDTPKFFNPMLAHKLEDYKDKLQYPLFSQPKLDGIRCIVRSDGMWSRNGKKIISAPHIFEALKPLFETNPDLIFDGELYADKFANDFNAICSIVKKTKPTSDDLVKSKESIQYHIYDLPSCSGTFIKRLSELTNLESNLPLCCEVVATNFVKNESEIDEWYSDYVNQGYEGQMIRLDKEYEQKRSKSLLKHKSFIDEEYTIIDLEEGGGNKTGMVGSFIFENKDGKRFNASPKFNWETCIDMWNNRYELIGKQATVKYFNLTPGDSPVPRFPYVTAIRDYE
jgi:ATP-dependent DNA ligase